MATMEVRIFGDPVLRQRAHEVEDFDGSLAQLANDMLDTMRANDGVGLAANQVGILKRLFTWGVDLGEEEPDVPGGVGPGGVGPGGVGPGGVGPGGVGPGGIIGGAVVNPVLLDSSEELQEGDEGCLSFPGLFYPVDRPLRVEVAHQDLHGDDHTVQLEGFLARIFLHEMDHLNGILFIDHLAEHDRKAAMKVMREQRLAEQGQAPSAPVAGGLLLGSSGVRGRGDGAVRLDRPRGS